MLKAMEDIKELLEKIVDADPAEFAKTFKDQAPKLYQYVWNGGHKTAKSDAEKTIKKLEGKIEEFDGERAKLEDRIETLSKEQPDLAGLQSRHEAVLLAKDETHKKELADREKNFERLMGQFKDTTLDRTVSDVVRDLVAGGVDRDYAIVQTSIPGFRERIRQDDDGRITGAMQKDGQTPFPLSDGQTVSAVLAHELLDDVPDKWREDRRQSGAGLGDRGGPRRKYTSEELEKMPDEKFEKAMSEIDEAARQGTQLLEG